MTTNLNAKRPFIWQQTSNSSQSSPGRLGFLCCPAGVCLCLCVCVFVCVCVCERERMKDREKERDNEREREGDRERESVCMRMCMFV